jgi:hypothetical protein
LKGGFEQTDNRLIFRLGNHLERKINTASHCQGKSGEERWAFYQIAPIATRRYTENGKDNLYPGTV